MVPRNPPRFALLAYPGIEPIDIGASFGVLSMARRVVPDLAFFVVAPQAGPVEMANGLAVIAPHGLADCPEFDVLMVLGGPGWEQAAADPAMLDFIRAAHTRGAVVSAICTGGMILGATGLLDGRAATTKAEILPGEARPLDLLAERVPGADIRHARIVDTGAVVTGGGVSLGHDVTLHLLGRFCGAEAAAEVARILEYGAAYQANADRLGDVITAT